MSTDPICGMQVDESTALRAESGGKTVYFCCERCRKAFLAQALVKSGKGHRHIVRNILRALGTFRSSDTGSKATALFACLIVFMLSINGLNVLNSYVGRDFISAIETRNMSAFMVQSGLYVLVFALSTVVAVFYRFAEERLGLLWRVWQTRQLLGQYLGNRIYYRLAAVGELENPDQRIAEDVRAFTTTSLSFVLMSLNATFTVLAFSGVLWSISPLLFGVAVAYASAGSLVTFLLGRRLMGLNYAQSDREANFRSELIGVRENAEPLAILHREGRLKDRLLRRLDELAANAQRVIAINRNVGFFTTIYNYLIPIIPVFVVAHLFMRGQVEFGVVTQSAIAFAQLTGAFSLIVTQFQSISSYAAVTARLHRMSDAMEAANEPSPSPIAVCDFDGKLTYENLTLRSEVEQTLISGLNLTISRGTRMKIVAANGHAKSAFFKATAGLWNSGEGRIMRPDADRMLFLTEQPCLPKGTLRELLVQKGQNDLRTDQQIEVALRSLSLESVIGESGGLDMEQDWSELLSLDEQALMAVARALLAAPDFVFLDRLNAFLSPAQTLLALTTLTQHGITYIALGRPEDEITVFDAVLEIAADGSWVCKRITEAENGIPMAKATPTHP